MTAATTTTTPADYSAPSPNLPPPSPHRPSSSSSRSPRLQSHPILLHPLPPSSALTKESVYASELELDKQTRQVRQERELREALQDQVWAVERSQVREEQGTWSKLQSSVGDAGTAGDARTTTQGFVHPPQAYELYRAIDKHDIDYVMRVRDHAFNLLLQKNGAEFPIVYASRLGQGWRDVVILLVGALSRYVNHLEPEDFEKKETKSTLKSLRVNLKLAIDRTLLHLPPGQTPMLLSSYLQVLIMSEGDSFLHKSIASVSLLVRAALTTSSSIGTGGEPDGEPDARPKPVAEAIDIVRRFCTKELRGVRDGVADVEEYIANAALDLVLMSTWSLAAGQMGVDNLPTHTFARDLRTCTTLSEAMATHEAELRKVNPRIRKVLLELVERAGDGKVGVRGRLREVGKLLDG